MAQKKMTTRWLTSSFGVIVIILVLVEFAFAFAVRMYYYNSVQQTLLSQASVITSLLSKYAEDTTTDYQREVRNLIENFDLRNQMELMAVGPYGDVLVTSSGFEVTEKIEMPDFQQALSSASRMGSYRGAINRENVLAISMLSPSSDESFAAVRLVVSLENVDRRILTMIIFAVLIGAAILFFVVLSSSYFISSIVIPVGEIGKTARKIAQGDFNARLQKKNDDEIGELCETINYMAEELQTAEKLKNEFISSVSHELRTPLTAIKGWGETILDGGEIDSETLTKGMKVIISETDRLSGMVEELLDFSRIQSGRMRLSMEKIDLLAELEEAVLMYTEKAKRDNIELMFDEPETALAVIGDRNRLRQVFINVIDNAIKYSNPGCTVAVACGLDNDAIYISVTDNGCGISREDLPKIKQKFYKANLTRRGSGIGLAVADEIIAMHNGSMEIESELGIGTTVTILLPTVRRYEQLEAQKAQPQTKEEPD